MKIILASASPRRKELLKRMGLEFEVFPSRGEEIITKEMPSEAVMELAQQKAASVAAELMSERAVSDLDFMMSRSGHSGVEYEETQEDILVIGADTIVVNEGRILGKPEDAGDACRMLRSLSGKTHQVYTGVCLLLIKGAVANQSESEGTFVQRKKLQEEMLFAEKTDVTFYPMTEEEILNYVATGDPLDKAGAYGIQGPCGKYIKGIHGDYNNVVGLPIARLYREMKNFTLLLQYKGNA